jgi:hypothetical protein
MMELSVAKGKPRHGGPYPITDKEQFILKAGLTIRQKVFTEEETKNAMTNKQIILEQRKKIALVAHDNKKRDLLEWAKYNCNLLAHHELYATGTTGTLLQKVLDLHIHKLQSGPLGGTSK